MIWITCVTQYPDTLKGPLKGVFKAMAWQMTAVKVNLSGHYGVNLFFIWLLAFKFDLQQKGLQLAKLILEFYVATVYLVILFRVDWLSVTKATK